MDKKSFKDGDGQIAKSVPPIIDDPEAAKNIEDTTESGGSVMNSISSGNFVISLILGGSMQQLWGMIRALQMIILSALVRTPIPAVTFMFFQGCMMFAQMDIFDGQGWYEQWFEFKETTMHSEMFEMMGIGDKNFMMNSGSYFIIGGGLALYYIGRYILNSFAKSYPSSHTIRKIGIYAYEQSYLGNFWMAFLKLTVESYFDLAMCSAMQL